MLCLYSENTSTEMFQLGAYADLRSSLCLTGCVAPSYAAAAVEMRRVLPQLSFELLWRYCVRAVLFPIMPIFVFLFKAMLYVEETYHWIRDTYRGADSLDNPTRKSIDQKTKLEIPHLVTYQSFYFTARDGTRLAVDVWLPVIAQQGTKVSTVFHQARYYR